MTNRKINHPLEGQIADYLNGHLSEGDVRTFEAAIVSDAGFREIVEFERHIQATVTKEQPAPQSLPDFDRFAEKLNRRSWLPTFAQSNWVAPVAAALLLTVVVGYNNRAVEFDNINDDYTVLTDPAVSYDRPVLRIVAKGDVSLSDLLEEYPLSVVERYPSANAVVVEPLDRNTVESLADMLADDERVRFVKVILPEQ